MSRFNLDIGGWFNKIIEMGTRTSFAPGEWHHCYNRGVDKRKVFQSTRDYDRFVALLFLSNATERVHLSDYRGRSVEDLLQMQIYRGKQLVEIGAWCLMPNHIHLLLREVEENGIALFMQKIFTGYTMYFNKKNERTGALFAGTFKSIHVNEDLYLKHVVAYIHMNPVELHHPDWKDGLVSAQEASRVLDKYAYSSLGAFEDSRNKYKPLLGTSVFEMFDVMPKRIDMLKSAQEYFFEHNVKV